jgi:hypothetical protein
MFAETRSPNDAERLRQQFGQSRLFMLREERISPNVLRALELDITRRLATIRNKVRWFLFFLLKNLAGVKGTRVYESFRAAECEYFLFVLRMNVFGDDQPPPTGQGAFDYTPKLSADRLDHAGYPPPSGAIRSTELLAKELPSHTSNGGPDHRFLVRRPSAPSRRLDRIPARRQSPRTASP